MCGIVAIFAYGAGAAPVNSEELLRMRDFMRARGPDGKGDWFAPNRKVALGHRRLAIIELGQGGAQPMSLRPHGPTITFNGEILNYREIKLELEMGGIRFRSNSDTEVLLHLYDLYGERMVERLRGMYAFAIYDPQKHAMLLVRDPFGIKPLYYYDDGSTIRVASQVRALLAGAARELSVGAAGHAGFFLWGHVPEPFTLYREIVSLRPGHSLWIDEHGSRTPACFFNIEASYGLGTSRTSMRPLRDVLSDSIAAHLVADVPVSIFLSSGVDSTAIAALSAQKVDPRNLKTFTLGFAEYRGTPNDETVLAAETAALLGTDHEVHWIAREDFISSIAHILHSMDQPTVDGINTYFVSKMAAAAGARVVLSGLGGDELFGSYPSFKGVPRLACALRALHIPRALGKAARHILSPVIGHITSPKYAGIFEYGTTIGEAFLMRRALYMPWELEKVLDPDLARAGLAELQVSSLEHVKADKTDHAAISNLEINFYMQPRLLRDSDWASMAHSLELRVPLVDRQLFTELAPRIASATPPTKSELMMEISELIPAQLLNRRKSGFSIPVRDWIGQQLTDSSPQERGLRGWAKYVYSQFTG